MNRNIIDAIGTLIMRKPFYLDGKYFTKEHSIDRRWTLEVYVRDLFADSFDAKDFDEKVFRHGEVFSYSGNLTNPPDLMLNGGDAIEIKNIKLPEKIQRAEYRFSPLILNTVYPRQKLFVADPLVTNSCRNAEKWTEKDIIYAVGVSKGKQLTHFCMVYGQDYCASAKYYKEILTEMRARLKDIPSIHFSDERYLGRVEATDPTGATYLDLRNVWYIKNPWSFFSDVYRPNPNAKFNFMCIIREEKFFSFRNRGKLFAWQEICPNLIIKQVGIKDPDNPDKMNDALLICYEV